MTRDLMTAAEERGLRIMDDAADVALHDIGGDSPYLTFDRDGREQRLDARFIVAATDSTGRRATPSPPPPR